MYPRLETAGFLAVGFVSLRLFIHVLRPELHQPDWFTLVVVTALFSWGLSRRQLISAPDLIMLVELRQADSGVAPSRRDG